MVVNNKKSNNGAAAYRVACAVVFFAFCFVYLYFYQADVLTAGQHIASAGKTQYSPLLGAILITIALKLLQLGIQAIAKLKRIFYALTYLPSFLILAVITDLPSNVSTELSFGAWEWVFPLVIVVWIVMVVAARQYQPVENEARGMGFFSQVAGINNTLMLAMMIGVCLIGNHNRLFHQRMNVEALLSRGDFDGALKSAENVDSTDATIRMLRAYALVGKGNIGNELFKHDMNGQKSIIPYYNGMNTVIIPQNIIVNSYRRNIDWQLSELLVEKKLNDFMVTLRKVYNLDADSALASIKDKVAKDSIMKSRWEKVPIHYREAAVLFAFKHNVKAVATMNPKEADGLTEFMNLDEYDKRKNRFGDTYWFFYLYK